ncbi:MAG: tyrosine-type recombinase/integrase [Chitinophagales bacterium]|nr:tyrosine-type recombinase/integrase [Chitinophagaceae bacterium]MCB9065454.1 tyrosine-type recombinase/integrase [Chitinophagales bacterium]
MDIRILAQEFYDYAHIIRGNTKATINRFRWTINCFVSDTGITDISKVNYETTLAFFYRGRTIRKWSSATYHTYHVSLLVFFRWCVLKGVLQDNPLERIEKPKLEKRLPKKLSKELALRLLEVVFNYPYKGYDKNFIRARNHAIFATFIFAGLRMKELLNLHLTDVDIEHYTLFIRQGKGSKDRVVPISYPLAQSLQRYVVERNMLNKTCPEFFVSSNRNLGFTVSGLKRIIEFARSCLGVHINPHMLRHTFATLMLEGGCDIYSLSKMMGHSDIKTTTIYLSATTSHLRSQITKHPLNTVSI